MLKASKGIASQAAPKPRKHHLVTSERLYLLGLELMDGAMERAEAAGKVSKVCAFQYRDGLIILLLALIPLRRRTLTALRVGKHLVRAGNAWMLDIPREDTKTDEQLEFLLCETLSRRIDLYLERFRGRIPNAAPLGLQQRKSDGWRHHLRHGHPTDSQDAGIRRDAASIQACSPYIVLADAWRRFGTT